MFRPSANKLLDEIEDTPSKEGQIYAYDAGFQVHLTSSQSQTKVLAELATEEVRLIIPLDDLTRGSTVVPTSEEKTLLSALESLDDLDGDTNLLASANLDGVVEGEYDVLEVGDVDGLTPNEAAGLAQNQDEAPGSWWMTLLDETKRPILLSAACVAVVMLVFLCTVTALYAVDFINVSLFNSRDLFNILPRVENGGLGVPQGKVGREEKKLILDSPGEAKEGGVFDEKSDIDNSFEDAPEVEHEDPDFFPLPDHTNEQPPPPLNSTNSQMRERTSTTLPPSWSIRASESQPLSIPGAYVFDPLPLPFSEVRTETGEVSHRPYSDPNPEIDIALAMQLRPGLGEGADAAWVVRFLMGVFGWVTVMVSGNRQ